MQTATYLTFLMFGVYRFLSSAIVVAKINFYTNKGKPLFHKIYLNIFSPSCPSDLCTQLLNLLCNYINENWVFRQAVRTKKYHVFAPMGRFHLELIYLYFPPSSQLLYLCFFPVGLSLL